MEEDNDKPFADWAILELMGHRRLAGYVQEVEMAGTGVLRIEVPAIEGGKPFTQFYSVAAIYCVTPTTEEMARAVASRAYTRPVQRYELPPARDAEDDDSAEEL